MSEKPRVIYVSEAVHKQARIYAAHMDLPIRQVVEAAISEWCARNEGLIPPSHKPKREKKSAAV